MKTLFKNATVYNMNGENTDGIISDILIEDGKIVGVEKNINVDNAEVLDCKGKFIMPGLFDGHVHLNSDEMLGLFIANGVTSVRNMWGYPVQKEWDKEVWEGKRVGPYLYSTGPLIDAVEIWKGCYLVHTPEEAIKAVDTTIEGGWRYVKVYPSLSREAMLALMFRANEKGIKVVGHMAHNVGPRTLADMGYHCVEHSSSLPKNLDDIRYLAQSGMWFCPTQTVENTMTEHMVEEKSPIDIEHAEYVHKALRGRWEGVVARRRENYAKRGPFFESLKTPEEVPNRGKVFMIYSDRILLGTDTPNPGVVAGFTIHGELKEMVYRFGMSPYKAIWCGTANVARHLGIENKKGRLLPGMDADILVLSKNPFVDISNSSSIEYVVQGGRIYDEKAIEEIKLSCKNRPDSEITVVFKT